MFLRRTKSQPGEQGHCCGSRGSEPLQLVWLQQSRADVMEIVRGGDDWKEKADQAQQRNGGGAATAAGTSARKLLSADSQQRH